MKSLKTFDPRSLRSGKRVLFVQIKNQSRSCRTGIRCNYSNSICDLPGVQNFYQWYLWDISPQTGVLYYQCFVLIVLGHALIFFLPESENMFNLSMEIGTKKKILIFRLLIRRSLFLDFQKSQKFDKIQENLNPGSKIIGITVELNEILQYARYYS